MTKFPKCEDHYSGFLIVQDFPFLFASLTCRQEQFITVLGASWWSQCARIQPGNNIQWYILKVRISSRLRTPIDDHTLIVVYSIPVKCPGYSVQQFYSILVRCRRCSNALVLAILPDAALFLSRCLPSTIPTQWCRKRHQTWSVDGLTEPRTHFIIFIRGKY